MNRFLLFIIFVAAANFVSAQVSVTLHMTQRLGGEPFAYNTATQADMGYSFNMTRMQYYISEIKLIHDGGIITPVQDLYFLVDPAVDTEFPLGSFAINTLEKIYFSIGVDPAHNHLDPSTYPANHPLAPQNPSMHWGWASGYRFIAIEGFAGADNNSLNNNYQIHTVGDENYRIVTVDVAGELNGDDMAIHIQVDYENFLDNIDASAGIISHSASGPSRTIAENTRIVFSPLELTSVVEPGVRGSFKLSPNPVKGFANIQFEMEGYGPLFLSITDLMGRQVYYKSLDNASGNFELNMDWPAGIYITQLFNAEQLLAIEKISIQ